MSWSIWYASFPTCREDWTPKWNHKNLPHRHTNLSPGRTKFKKFNIKNAVGFFFPAFLGLSGALVLLFWVCVHGKSQVLQSRSQANGPWRLCAVSSTPSRLLMAFLLRAFNHYKNKSVLDLPFAQITYEQKMEVLKNFILFLISGDFLTCCVCTVRLWLIMVSTIGLLSEITAVQDCLLYIQTEHLMTFKSVLFKYNHFHLQGTVQSPSVCKLRVYRCVTLSRKALCRK